MPHADFRHSGVVAGNGLIDFDEFLQMMECRDPAKNRSQDAEMRALFAAFDKDDSGYIDGHELKLTMRDVGMDLTNRDVEMMMKAAGVAIKDRIFYEGTVPPSFSVSDSIRTDQRTRHSRIDATAGSREPTQNDGL